MTPPLITPVGSGHSSGRLPKNHECLDVLVAVGQHLIQAAEFKDSGNLPGRSQHPQDVAVVSSSLVGPEDYGESRRVDGLQLR